MDLHGIGSFGAARLLVDVGDINRFPHQAHVASWNGTAPLDHGDGPGRTQGTSTNSSVTGSHPHAGSSEKSLPADPLKPSLKPHSRRRLDDTEGSYAAVFTGAKVPVSRDPVTGPDQDRPDPDETMRWKPALNAFATPSSARFPAADTYWKTAGNTVSEIVPVGHGASMAGATLALLQISRPGRLQ